MIFRARALSIAATTAVVLGTFLGVFFDGGSRASADPPSAAQPGVVRADVDDFEIASFDAAYALGRDDEGRSTLHTVETIVAVFPDFDQNRGLIRDLVRTYDGHDTSLAVLSVTDEHGEPRSYSTEESGDFLSVIMAVPEGSFVHGTQSYVIEYTQRDVTRYFEDTGVDEFYWDLNGTGWAQPFQRVGMELTLTADLGEAFTGDAACYRGRFGSDESCVITAAETDLSTGTDPSTGTALTFTVEETELLRAENVTVAFAFAPGTFSPVPTPFLERVPVFFYAGLASLLAAIGYAVVSVVRIRRGSRTGRAIIAQYEPPHGMPAALAAELLRAPKKAMTATLLDLAVRRKIRLLHDEPTDAYGAQLLDDTGLHALESTVCSRLFAKGPGTSLWFTRRSTRLGDTAAALTKRATTEAQRAGFTQKSAGKATGTTVLLLVLALAFSVLQAVLTGNFVLMTVLLAVGINVLIWASVGFGAMLARLRSFTPEGALARDHLMGLREYIRLAEADRIRMLQSASGAEVDTQRIVQVTERLLPYAVLFGYEQEWQQVLAKYYAETPPDWIAGSAATSFSRAISFSMFTTTVVTSPRTQVTSSGSGSGSSFSSFSGGSSGGGFSGGGGGGGGGRGI